ncbi:MAG: DUF72 domain-containing protein [Planctomycetota bacterium]|nr:DUF72 domain-containing protein [Planctomycetota bacterium]
MHMDLRDKFIIGTSGYSFDDWVGQFYPTGTRRKDMFGHYIQHFRTVELNFTYYRIPSARTMHSLSEKSPDDFLFWVKANQKTTHEQDRSVAGEFLAGLRPMRDSGKLAGVLLQFPQRFHRTVANREYLAYVADDFESVPLAVEFRHVSWDHPSTLEGLADRNITLVVPDVPTIEGLYRPIPAVTTDTGYLRLHSRNAANWYEGMAQRYDFSYSREELRKLLDGWSELVGKVRQMFCFFNNCHKGSAAANALAMRDLLLPEK